MLRQLKEFSERPTDDMYEAAVPEEYKQQPIPWIIMIEGPSSHATVVSTIQEGDRGGRPKQFVVPYLKRSGKNPNKVQLLADSAEVILGLAGDDDTRAERRHRAFLAMLDACAQHTGHPGVGAALRTLTDATAIQLPADLKFKDFMQVMVDGVFLINLPEVQDFWARVAPHLSEKGVPNLTSQLVLSWLGDESSSSTEEGMCICCGAEKQIVRIHPIAISLPRSVADQNVHLVSANKSAFWSYGMEQSVLAPTCRDCAAAYARGLNRLARDSARRVVVQTDRDGQEAEPRSVSSMRRIFSTSMFVMWTREPTTFNAMDLLDDPEGEMAEMLQTLARGGRGPGSLDETRLYATSITASGARVVVRDWIDTTVGNVKESLRRWFKWQEITDPHGERRLHGIHALGRATVRRKPNGSWDDVPRPTLRALMHSALIGTPVPLDILYQAVRRNRAEQDVTRARAALIKLVLCSQPEYEHMEDTMVDLNLDIPDVAYRCGRLLAVLERAQWLAVFRQRGARQEANGQADANTRRKNNTIVSRYFGTVSTAPGVVLPHLLKGVQPHLATLQRDNPGAAYYLQQSIEDILSGVGVAQEGDDLYYAFPAQLNPRQQSLFSLGYYHQRAYERYRRTSDLATGDEDERDDTDEENSGDDAATNPA